MMLPHLTMGEISTLVNDQPGVCHLHAVWHEARRVANEKLNTSVNISDLHGYFDVDKNPVEIVVEVPTQRDVYALRRRVNELGWYSMFQLLGIEIYARINPTRLTPDQLIERLPQPRG